jgi:hypothetical protein
MRVDILKKLFAGVRIDGRMREQLDKCPQRDRVFFESTDGRYLTMLRGGEDTYIGKVLDAASPLSGIDDIRRNVWSILLRICPGRRDENDIKLFALDDAEVEPTFSPPRGTRGYSMSQPGMHQERPQESDEDDYY